MIRIELVAMDKTLSDMITDLLAPEPDMAVVGWSGSVAKAMSLAKPELPDVLLLQDGRAGDGLMAAALSPRPPAVLCISANGREGWTLRFAAERQPIEAADGGLAAAVRRATDAPRVQPRTEQ